MDSGRKPEDRRQAAARLFPKVDGLCFRCQQRPIWFLGCMCKLCTETFMFDLSMETARRYPPDGPKPTEDQLGALVVEHLERWKAEVLARAKERPHFLAPGGRVIGGR